MLATRRPYFFIRHGYWTASSSQAESLHFISFTFTLSPHVRRYVRCSSHIYGCASFVLFFYVLHSSSVHYAVLYFLTRVPTFESAPE